MRFFRWLFRKRPDDPPRPGRELGGGEVSKVTSWEEKCLLARERIAELEGPNKSTMHENSELHDSIDNLQAALAAKDEEIARLKKWEAFGLAIIDAWDWRYDVDGGNVQDLGVKHGILREVDVTEPCSEDCYCEEVDNIPGVCYRLAGTKGWA